MIPDSSVDPNEFPLPFAVSGTKPKIGTKGPLTQTPETKAVKPGGSTGTDPAGGGRTAAAVSAPARKKAEPSHSTDGSHRDPASIPNDANDPAETDPAKKKPRKPLSLDPAILQPALQLRNQGR